MTAGDKVICIYAGKNPDAPEYNSPLIAGNVYVVKAAVTTPSGMTGIQLIGVSLHPAWSHQSFLPRRFRLLQEMKMKSAQFTAATSLQPK